MNDFMPQESPVVSGSKTHFSNGENGAPEIDVAERGLQRAESTNDFARRFLQNYEIGPKLRQLRLRKKIALVDLGRHTGLSASMLSQLENGKLIPTLPTLARIASVFDVGLEFFFGEKRPKRVFSIVRATERLRFPELTDDPLP